ncbi:UDP-Glycosyltransferase/glycogen phosphorylase [Cubamyces lactineus]|nr:UDP-Glycosyltransferase/glycogen phosphorylase [Cubamyces lactineus]
MDLPAPDSHLVSFAFEAWGHTRPLIAFAARVVKMRPVLVTLFTTDAFYGRIKTELSRSFEPDEEAYRSRLRLVSIAHGNTFAAEPLDSAFAVAWRKLLNGEDVVCTKTGDCFPTALQPDALLVEFFSNGPIREVRASCGDKVKIYVWLPNMLAAFWRTCGPEDMGGLGNAHRKALEEARTTGKSYEEIAFRMIFGGSGVVVRPAGMPPMYDYEYHPQRFTLLHEMGSARFTESFDTLELTDGIVSSTAETYEREMVRATRKWCEDNSKQAFVVGPLRVSGTNANAYEKELSAASTEVEAFLQNALVAYGEKSVLYISFGSFFWPVEKPEMLWVFLDVVMELKIPFILSCASPLAMVPDAVKEKVKTYGKGLIATWNPQQFILGHPATGWFVTHGGQNSVLESIATGVPQIFWPFEGDQPLNAVNMTENFDAAYELIEVRTGDGTKPIFRNGRKPVGTIEAVKAEARDVLTKAFGEDGVKKRERLLRLQQEVLSEWDEGGASRRDFMAFLDSLRA